MSRIVFFTAASAAALLSTSVLAQTAPAPAGQAVEEVVVTGSRAPPRSRLESLAPVDVVTAKTLQQMGTSELGAALAVTVQLVPGGTFDMV